MLQSLDEVPSKFRELEYRAEIDGLRCLAVLPVIFFHAGFPLFEGGWVGVDIFFVISGYLITTILLGDIYRKDFSILAFYDRRARRIIPALMVTLAFTMLFGYLLMTPSELVDLFYSALSVNFFVSNLHFFTQSGYFEIAAEENPLLHAWSLSVEEQFYLIFPFALLLLGGLRQRNIFIALTVVAVISLASSEYLVRYTNAINFNFFITTSRVWELLAGSISAVALYSRGPGSSNLLSFAGIALISVAIAFFEENSPSPGLITLIPVIGTVLLICFCDKNTLLSKFFLCQKPIVFVGLISYSAYLFHQPFFAFYSLTGAEFISEFLDKVLLISLVLGLAYVSYRFIEAPFRRRNLFNRKQVFTLTALSVLVASTISIWGITRDGFPSRFQGLDGLVGATGAYEEVDECFLVSGAVFKNECLKDGSSAILFGDSHAASLYPGLKESFEKSGEKLSQFTYADCLPMVSGREFASLAAESNAMDQLATSRCAGIESQFRRILVENPQIESLVVLIAYGNWVGFTPKTNLGLDYIDLLLAKLRDLGMKRTIIVGPPPYWSKPPGRLLLRQRDKQSKMSTRLDKRYVWEDIFFVDKALEQKAEEYGFNYISILEKVCHEDACIAATFTESGPTPLQYDYAHLTKNGADFFSRYINLMQPINSD